MAHAHLRAANRIGMPTPYFASAAFNAAPVPTHIAGVQEAHKLLFDTLDQSGQAEMPHHFIQYMTATFNLPRDPLGQRLRGGFVRLLKGWFFDANRPEGALLKGWAESRFGLIPLFHGAPIESIETPTYAAYRKQVEDPQLSKTERATLFAQCDLLYEYCQYTLARFGRGEGGLVLYRGTNRVSAEHRIREERGTRVWVVRINSLASFTSEKERACEFGDTILKVTVPFEKVVWFPGLLPGSLPGYEGEYILIGGDYVAELVPF